MNLVSLIEPLLWALWGLAVFATAFSNVRGAPWVCLALLVSIGGAQVATFLGNPLYMTGSLGVAFLLICSISKDGISFRCNHWTAKAIAWIYAIRMVWVAIYGLSGMESVIFWSVQNELFAGSQFILGIIGGASGGYRHIIESVRSMGWVRHASHVVEKWRG